MAHHFIHVLFYGKDGKWRVKREGSSRALAVFSKKESALAKARAFARREKAELVIHDVHGRISDKDSFGNDPFPPKDTTH